MRSYKDRIRIRRASILDEKPADAIPVMVSAAEPAGARSARLAARSIVPARDPVEPL